MADWVTISSLATAGGTLVLAVATFSSVRSANRSARVAERSLLVGATAGPDPIPGGATGSLHPRRRHRVLAGSDARSAGARLPGGAGRAPRRRPHPDRPPVRGSRGRAAHGRAVRRLEMAGGRGPTRLRDPLLGRRPR